MKPRVEINEEAFPRMRSAVEAFRITRGDLAGPLLVRIGQTHRKQEKRIFATEGEAGRTGTWVPLSPVYAAWKQRQVGFKPILVFTGDMKDKFVTFSNPDYIQRYVPEGTARGTYLLGARSVKAARHFSGSDVTRRSKPRRRRGRGEKRFKAKTFRNQLPARDMVSKRPSQVDALSEVIRIWYRDERVPQVVAALEKQRQLANRSLGR